MKKFSRVGFTYKKKATEEEQKKESYFIKDGFIDGQCGAVWTELNRFGMITLAECKEIYSKVLSHLNLDLESGECIKNIQIDLSDYYEYAEDGRPVYECLSDRIGYDKECRYNPNTNVMRIWEADEPIYENANGVICNDVTALCDSLL